MKLLDMEKKSGGGGENSRKWARTPVATKIMTILWHIKRRGLPGQGAPLSNFLGG